LGSSSTGGKQWDEKKGRGTKSEREKVGRRLSKEQGKRTTGQGDEIGEGGKKRGPMYGREILRFTHVQRQKKKAIGVRRGFSWEERVPDKKAKKEEEGHLEVNGKEVRDKTPARGEDERRRGAVAMVKQTCGYGEGWKGKKIVSCGGWERGRTKAS